MPKKQSPVFFYVFAGRRYTFQNEIFKLLAEHGDILGKPMDDVQKIKGARKTVETRDAFSLYEMQQIFAAFDTKKFGKFCTLQDPEGRAVSKKGLACVPSHFLLSGWASGDSSADHSGNRGVHESGNDGTLHDTPDGRRQKRSYEQDAGSSEFQQTRCQVIIFILMPTDSIMYHQQISTTRSLRIVQFYWGLKHKKEWDEKHACLRVVQFHWGRKR